MLIGCLLLHWEPLYFPWLTLAKVADAVDAKLGTTLFPMAYTSICGEALGGEIGNHSISHGLH